jgi:ABC-type lipoprotein export system ATPase subunit
MKDIQDYFKFLLKKYDLEKLYLHTRIYLNLYVFIRESFFWIIILSTQNKIEDKQKMLKIVSLLLSILVFTTIFEAIYLKNKISLKNKLNKAHLEYNFYLINNCKKSQVLSANLFEQFIYIESVKAGLDNIIEEQQVKAFIFATFITLIISSRRVNVILITSLLGIFNGIIYLIQKKNIQTEDCLTEENIENIGHIRDYYIDSKQKIINNIFNTDYCLEMFNKYFKNNLTLVGIENSVNTYNSIMIIVITFIIVFMKYKTSNIFDIFVYLLIVYDLDYFVDNLFAYYKIKKSYGKINLHLNKLLNKTVISPEKCSFQTINSIQIDYLSNDIPQLELINPIRMQRGDKILIDGKSGAGKTTIFKFLKFIESPKELILFVNDTPTSSFSKISDRVYLSIQNNKVVNNELLYDYISNHNKNTDISLIKNLLNMVCIDHIYSGNKNEMIQVDRLSGGEQVRLTLAQTLFNILNGDYDIILFDEIDTNLDYKTAQKIFSNIFNLLDKKLCIFIVHNEELKPMFLKQISISNHLIKLKN